MIFFFLNAPNFFLLLLLPSTWFQSVHVVPDGKFIINFSVLFFSQPYAASCCSSVSTSKSPRFLFYLFFFFQTIWWPSHRQIGSHKPLAGRSLNSGALTPIETEEPRLAVKSKTGLSITPRIHGNKEMGTVNARWGRRALRAFYFVIFFFFFCNFFRVFTSCSPVVTFVLRICRSDQQHQGSRNEERDTHTKKIPVRLAERKHC